ncbi:ankyrin repeat domain-containing protein [Pedobacter cryophilus]|uniref:Ankyrin repeat domain-containing protein n=1 Tax=Pedobacter cryophilus TaxID=2571271 RepID=A0A4U1BTN7_9SPHI|nr:ankyrin repeat domain-containing protein [Pedobacter cryophilus]TKB95281.1 ankyrin repeat domain-containing protein [Pedobacter cryophilus]
MQQTFLEELIIAGDEIAVKDYLLSNLSAINELTSHGVSPLMLSCYFKKPEITTILIELLDEITLFEASAAGKFDVVAHEIFKKPEKINDYSDDGFTALGLAAYFGREEVARYLVLKGADVNLSSKNGYHVFPLHSAVAGNHLNISRMLIENGAIVNVAQMSGVTPLHSAAQNGSVEIIILLLEKGAKVDIRMEGGKLPSDLAKEKGFEDIAEILSF